MSDTITLSDARDIVAAAEKCAEKSQPGEPFFGIHASTGGRVVIFAGGIPLQRNSKIVGGKGVSGGDDKQDQTVGEAGAGAL